MIVPRVRRVWTAAALAFAAIAIAALAVAYVVLPARRFLDRWEEHGLPGHAPRAKGPFSAIAWPPELRWTDLEWEQGDSLRLHCASLRVVFDPAGLIRRESGVDRVVAGRIRIDGAPRHWSIAAGSLATLGQEADANAAPEIAASGIAVETGEVVLSRGVALGSLHGRIVSRGRGEWAAQGIWLMPRSRRAAVRAQGVSTSSTWETRADLDLGPGRTIHLDARKGLDERWTWLLSGRDDGAIPPLLFPDWLAAPNRSPVAGGADFSIGRATEGALEGEAHFDAFPLRTRGGGVWRADGVICLSRRFVSLQDLQLAGETAALRIAADLPRYLGESGPLRFEGEWSGASRAMECTVSRNEQGWKIESAGDTRRIDFVATAPLGGAPVEIRIRETPLAELLPWLPFQPPGQWSGTTDARFDLRMSPAGWSASGGATLRAGRIEGLSVLQEIADLTGRKADRSLRYDRADLRWTYADGAVLLDTLTIVGPSVRISARVAIEPSDSLMGWIRLVPTQNKGLSALFRLLAGEEAGLELSIAGNTDAPEITVLSGAAARSWLLAVESRLARAQSASPK